MNSWRTLAISRGPGGARPGGQPEAEGTGGRLRVVDVDDAAGDLAAGAVPAAGVGPRIGSAAVAPRGARVHAAVGGSAAVVTGDERESEEEDGSET